MLILSFVAYNRLAMRHIRSLHAQMHKILYKQNLGLQMANFLTNQDFGSNNGVDYWNKRPEIAALFPERPQIGRKCNKILNLQFYITDYTISLQVK
jgi:hypothetical protein